MKRFLKALTLTTLLTAGVALTQNSNVTITYDALAVQKAPKPVVIDPSSHTIIRFYDRLANAPC